ncbi:MAG: YdcF family protein [Pseudomonadales bacterium]|nr:YdcF family protein [Pseudomonadales bacterium]
MWVHLALKALLLPPVPQLALWGVLTRFRVRWAAGIVVATLLIPTLPMTAWILGQTLTTPPMIKPPPRAMIVVLGGGRLRQAPEYDHQDAPSTQTLERLRYGAALSRRYHLPIMVSGGAVMDGEVPEAQLMQRILIHDFAVMPAYLFTEDQSRNTHENAIDVAKKLGRGTEVILVTQALHMPRAMTEFQAAGLHPWAAAVGYYQPPSLPLLWFFPQISATSYVSFAWWEFWGRIMEKAGTMLR